MPPTAAQIIIPRRFPPVISGTPWALQTSRGARRCDRLHLTSET